MRKHTNTTPGADAVRVELLSGIERVDEVAWRALEPPNFPFFDFEFLRALEHSGSIGDASGWSPVYLVCKEGGRLLGALPLYLKTNSYGEYIFDWGWAQAYREHGLSYYPKLVAAVPFTPATGPKLLVRPDLAGEARAAVTHALFDAARELGDELRVSSTHALYLPERELGEFARRGFALRHSLQFHWRNRGYDAFSDYLGAHAATMHRFYLGTFDRKWGFPYLTKAFFAEVFRTMGDRTLLVLARDEPSGRPLAGALFFFKGGALYGRYWGAAERRRNLHFELCYYQAIEFAIERRLELFEAGAQGEHKHTRGFLPSLTYSAHEIRHPGFRRAIEHYIAEEKELLAGVVAEYAHHD